MIRCVALVAVILVHCTCIAARPTPAQIANAIEQSRGEWVEKNRPETKDERLARLESELQKVQAKKVKNRAELLKKSQDIKGLKADIEETRKSYVPATIEPRLMPLDWSNLSAGTVGHIGHEKHGRITGGDVIVDQILGPHEFIGHYQYATQTVSVNSGRPVINNITVNCKPALFAGWATEKLQEDGRYEVEWDVVVTAREEHRTVAGRSVLLYRIESIASE